jgi:hypothetical protein
MLILSDTKYTHMFLHRVDNLNTFVSWLEDLGRSRSIEIQTIAFILRCMYQTDINVDDGVHTNDFWMGRHGGLFSSVRCGRIS